MSLVVVGVHERDVPLEVLERLAVAPDELAGALQELRRSPHLAESVILSTCLRTEVYAVVERFHDGIADIEAFFAERAGPGWSTGMAVTEALRARHAGSGAAPAAPVPPAPTPAVASPRGEGTIPAEPIAGEPAAGGLYCAIDDAAAQHLFEVAAGLDSAVLGEGEVLRQVRQAHERARAEQVAGPVLERLFRHAVEVGKRARSETAIARGVTSLSTAAVALAVEELGGSLAGMRVLVVGAGEMGAGMIAAIERLPEPPALVVASRSRARAHEAARRLVRVNGEGVGLDALGRALVDVDVLLTCTAARTPVFAAGDLAGLMEKRPERPLFVVDLAVPRDVEAAAGAIAGVTLRDMDDLRAFAERHAAGRAAEVGRVRELVAAALDRYRADTAARSVAPVVAALRTLGESVRAGELERHHSRLDSLDDEQREAVEAITRSIVAKLLHEPTVRLKDAAGTPRGDRLGEALRALFDL